MLDAITSTHEEDSQRIPENAKAPPSLWVFFFKANSHHQVVLLNKISLHNIIYSFTVTRFG